VTAPDSPSSRAAAFPPGECARLSRALDDVATITPAGELRVTTPEPLIEAMMHRLVRVSSSLEELRDSLRSPVLAAEANQLMIATAYLGLQTARLFVLKHNGRLDEVDPYERALYVGGRQAQLAAGSAQARCQEDGSRDQSVAWQSATVETLNALHEPLHACRVDEQKRAPDRSIGRVEIKLHIGADGRVLLAGPIALDMSSAYSADLVYCVVRVLEKATFPPPEGKAIVLLPLVATAI
jgi:hypothetical protein